MVRALLFRVSVLAVCLLIAVVPRFVAIDTVITTDESYWMQRSTRFAAALVRGDWASTYRSGHPGVTVMWLGVLGIGPERLEPFLPAHFGVLDTLERAPGYLEAFGGARRAMALATAALYALVVALAWRLLGPGPGLLGGLLLLLDPYAIGMSRLLHVDAPLAPLMLGSALAGLVYWLRGRHWPYLVLSAALGALALLTKAPAAFLPLFFGLVGIASGSSWRRPGRWLVPVAAWGAVALCLCVALWPALWVQPVAFATLVARHLLSNGGSAHPDGNVFLGQLLTTDPGPLFYLVALAFRLSPLVLFGLAVLPVFVRRSSGRAAGLLWLAAYAGLFIAMMTLGSKKFDRYALPAIAALDLLAGTGLWYLAHWIGSRRTALATCALIAGVQAVTLARTYPYPIAYYNPLLGGPAGAQQALLVGWGEGLDQVVDFLSARTDVAQPSLATHYFKVVRPRHDGLSVPLYLYERRRPAGPPGLPEYVALYVSGVQRGQIPQFAREAMAAGAPIFTAYVNGAPYAWLYRIPDAPGGPTRRLPRAPELPALEPTEPGYEDRLPGDDE